MHLQLAELEYAPSLVARCVRGGEEIPSLLWRKSFKGGRRGRPRLGGAELWADEKLNQQKQWWNASKWPQKDLECGSVCTIWPFNLCVWKKNPTWLFFFNSVREAVEVERWQWMAHSPHEHRTERCWKTEENLFFGHLFSTTIIAVNLEVIGLASFSTYREKSVICVWRGEFNLFFLTKSS